MALPNKLKNMNLFGDGESWLGQVTETTLPKIARQMEDYRGAGLDAPVKIDMGGQALEMEIKTGGRITALIRKMGTAAIDGVALRFVGAYQADDTGAYISVEVYVRGRIEELDRGTQKVGEATEETVKFHPVYYRETENNAVLAEIDVLNMIYITDGVDRLADMRAAMGL